MRVDTSFSDMRAERQYDYDMMELQLDADVILRSSTATDLPGLLKVCLQTANGGKGATHLHNLHDLVGEIYVAPYVLHEPNFAFTLEVSEKVVGYVLGVLDTGRFESRLDREYWPATKAKYAALTQDLKPHDLSLIEVLNRQGFGPKELISKYPSHLHIDIIESHQGFGYGKTMILHLLNALQDAGSSGVHLHMSASNDRANGFYKKLGFIEIDTNASEIIMGLVL
jgi:ribosomal protein S18 acetylase RimI-like enzyme